MSNLDKLSRALAERIAAAADLSALEAVRVAALRKQVLRRRRN
jgi:hypothetical protein